MRLSYFLTTLVLLGLLTACGQKGDLYLPDKTTKPSADAVQVIHEVGCAMRTEGLKGAHGAPWCRPLA